MADTRHDPRYLKWVGTSNGVRMYEDAGGRRYQQREGDPWARPVPSSFASGVSWSHDPTFGWEVRSAVRESRSIGHSRAFGLGVKTTVGLVVIVIVLAIASGLLS